MYYLCMSREEKILVSYHHVILRPPSLAGFFTHMHMHSHATMLSQKAPATKTRRWRSSSSSSSPSFSSRLSQETYFDRKRKKVQQKFTGRRGLEIGAAAQQSQSKTVKRNQRGNLCVSSKVGYE